MSIVVTLFLSQITSRFVTLLSKDGADNSAVVRTPVAALFLFQDWLKKKRRK
jgi:hypothetical protein